jgi:exonuclease III
MCLAGGVTGEHSAEGSAVCEVLDGPAAWRNLRLSFSTWNSCGLGAERIRYVQEDVGHDITVLSELHGAHHTFASSNFICCGEPEAGDPAGGVAIALSNRASALVRESGHIGSRIVWVKMGGLLVDLYVVGVYIPHKFRRREPYQESTLRMLRAFLQQLPKRSAVMVLGDFNAKLKRDVKGLTGKYCMHYFCDTGGTEVMEIMREADLFAVSTAFQPCKGSALGNATYISKVEGAAPTQLDYVLVSNRFKSGVSSCKVRWGPSIHRFGHRFDHGMIQGTFRFRVAAHKAIQGSTDWGALSDPETQSDFDRLYEEARGARPAKVDYWADLEPEACKEAAAELHSDITVAVTAAKTAIPARSTERVVRRWARSEETQKLFDQRERGLQSAPTGSDEWKAAKRLFRNRIAHACRKDRRVWIEGIATEMQSSADRGDSRAVYEGVRRLSGKGRGPQKQPTVDGGGKDLRTAEQLAGAWADFAEKKFACTEAEDVRAWGFLPDAQERVEDVPSDPDLMLCVKALAKRKATGSDEAPIEVYQRSKGAREDLFQLVRLCWGREVMPESLAEGVFIALYKGKGSSQDFTKYRFICLLNHAYKVISTYLLLRLVRETEGYLPESQAGFRKGRSTRDNLYILTQLIDFCHANCDVQNPTDPAVLTFIDFVSAFDTVSHKFLDEALSEAGASDKVRGVFRTIYSAATARVRVRTQGGEVVLSRSFDVSRGVVQGDIFSPVCFVIALECLFRRCEEHGGVSLASVWLERLEYADDAALVDVGYEMASRKVTELEGVAKELADMEISRPKTEFMAIRDFAVSAAVQEDYDVQEWGFQCADCGRGFPSKHGLSVHRGLWCKQQGKEAWELESIVDVRGVPDERFYRVRWAGWAEEDDSWVNWRHLEALGAIDAFWDSSSLDRMKPVWLDSEAGIRCKQCCRLFSRAQDLKAHHTRKKGGCVWAEASRKGSKAEGAVVKFKKAAAHKAAGAVYMGEGKLVAAFHFKYLGIWFSADGDRALGREARMEQAADRFRQLGNIWNSAELSVGLKLRLYVAGIYSVLAYGCECWDLTEKAVTALRAWNARRLAMITGREIREEYLSPAFDLVGCARARRLKWAGQLLRAKESFLPRRVALEELGRTGGQGQPGGIFQDAPKGVSVEELVELACDRVLWDRMVGCLKNGEELSRNEVVGGF